MFLGWKFLPGEKENYGINIKKLTIYKQSGITKMVVLIITCSKYTIIWVLNIRTTIL